MGFGVCLRRTKRELSSEQIEWHTKTRGQRPLSIVDRKEDLHPFLRSIILQGLGLPHRVPFLGTFRACIFLVVYSIKTRSVVLSIPILAMSPLVHLLIRFGVVHADNKLAER